MHTLYSVLIGGALSLIGTLGTQWISARNQQKTTEYIKKTEYIMHAQQQLVDIFQKHIVILPTLVANDLPEKTKAFYEINGIKPNSLHNFIEYYSQLISVFFRYKHYLPQTIKKQCEQYYENLHNILLKDNLTFGEVNQLSDEEKKKLIIEYATLNGLIILGFIDTLEKFSKKIG